MKKIVATILLSLVMMNCSKKEPQPLETRMINGMAIIYEKGLETPYSGEFNKTETNPDGSIFVSESGTLKDGVLEGENRTNYNNGKLMKITNYRNGQLDGWETLYDINGNITRKNFYENGILKSPQTQNNVKSDNLLGDVEFVNSANTSVYKGVLSGKTIEIIINLPNYSSNAVLVDVDGFYIFDQKKTGLKGVYNNKNQIYILSDSSGEFDLKIGSFDGDDDVDCSLHGIYKSNSGSSYKLKLDNLSCGTN